MGSRTRLSSDREDAHLDHHPQQLKEGHAQHRCGGGPGKITEGDHDGAPASGLGRPAAATKTLA